MKKENNNEFAMKPVEREICIEGFHSIYYFEFDKDFSHPPQKNDFWELMYVDSGEVYAITNGVGTMLSQGQIIFNRPMEQHAHISNKRVPNNMLVITFTAHGSAMEFFEKKIFTLDKTQKTLLSLFMKEAEIALGKLPDEYSNKNPLDFSHAPFGSLQLLECYLTEFLLILKRSNERIAVHPLRHGDGKAPDSPMIEMITEYLKDCVRSDLSLGELCARFYIGKSRLCKMFRDHVGKSPMEYFTDLKMAEAKKLLRQGEFSVGRIADLLGFSSIHNFSRAFKKAVGFSPSEYRSQVIRKGKDENI
ncbi:MAG: helix-turn-helix transcriptional regulator [Clostridia bacterium]|nr:helix-turn-helix transcriptional regulator [Clostridia bacterium]